MANDAPLTLADIAGINMAEIKELRFENVPQAIGRWELVDSDMSMLKSKGHEVPGVTLGCKLIRCDAIVGDQPPLGKDSILGKVQKFRFQFATVEDIGRYKAFLIDAGVEINGPTPLQELVNGTKGLQFEGKNVWRTVTNENGTNTYASVQPIVPKAA